MADQRGIIRFGIFEINLAAAELRKKGARIKLQEQPFQVLAALLRRPGEIVTKEELKEKIWADDTFVDFDHSLSTAVNKIREALGDSATSPRFIETVPRRGYRFIGGATVAPGDGASGDAAPGDAVAVPTETPTATIGSRRWWAWGLAAVALVALVVFGISARRHLAEPAPPAPAGQGRPSNNAEANGYFSKAQLFMGFGLHDLRRARQMLERALELDPRFGKARAEYGFTHLIMVNIGYTNDSSWLYEAEEQIQQGLRDDPGFSHGYAALAALYLHHGRKELVPREIEKALKLNPRDIDAKHWLATYHWYSGDSATARKLERENLAQSTRFFPAQMVLGELARQEGDWEASIREHAKVLEYDPQNGFVLEFLAWTYMDAGDLAKARQILDRLRPDDRRSFRNRAVEALLLALEGKRDEAARAMDIEVLKYIELNPLFTLTGAEFHAVMGNKPQALEWLERAVRYGDERAQWFARDPALESIRGEPRFQQILDSIATRWADSG
jgi:DNA-binding winged helix-turn-helix (wHTH) protein/Tfp pilus assembly protein PilF